MFRVWVEGISGLNPTGGLGSRLLDARARVPPEHACTLGV